MSGLTLKMPELRLGAVDTLLASALIALLMLGFVAMGSASIEYATNQYNNGFYHIQRHGIYLVLALLAGAFTYGIPTQALRRHGWWLLLLHWLRWLRLTNVSSLLPSLSPPPPFRLPYSRHRPSHAPLLI